MNFVYIFYADINSGISDVKVRRLIKKVPKEICKKIYRIKNKLSFLESVAGLMILSQSLQWLGYSENSISSLKINPFGKPYLDNRISFNISHSDGMVVCGITNSQTIGIDIERIRSIDVRDFIDFIPSNKRTQFEMNIESFFNYWTKLESVLKADGRGLGIPISNIIWKKGSTALLDNNEYKVEKVKLSDGCLCHFAIELNTFGISVHEIPTDWFKSR